MLCLAARLQQCMHDPALVAVARPVTARFQSCLHVGMQAYKGLLSSHGYAVHFPDSSTIGMSPSWSKPPLQSAESNHSDDRYSPSNLNARPL